jgi:hypothetical protein
MKAVIGIFIVQDEGEEQALTNSIMEEVAQHWPTFAVETREATPDEKKWFKEEYADPMGWRSAEEA